ncbi:MAG TPA: ABC transporter substrate-binding protein [Pseudonocardiaceae bacterium]
MRFTTIGKGIGAGVAAAALVIGPGLAPAGAPAVPAAQAQGEVTMRVAHAQEIDTLNPFTAVFLVSTQIGRLMYEFLTVNSAESSSPEPGLAESWESSEDNLTWTFKIREAKWSDGQPITAKDAAFTYNLIMSNEAAATANGVAVANYESVTATDDRTLVIKTKTPQASMLSSEVPIVPEHVWSKVTDIEAFQNTEAFPAVGSGPFVLTGYQQGQSTTLKANDNFWRGRPKVDVLQWVKYENADAAVQGLRKGDVDIAYRLTPAQFDALKSDGNITTNDGRNRRFTEITLNPSNPKPDGTVFGNGNPVLKDVKLRQALHHAIDVDTILDKVKQGHASAATQIIPPVYPDWTYTPDDSKLRKYDPAKANALLDEAGYARGADGTRTDKQGQPINLRLLVTSDRQADVQSAEYIKEWFGEIGIGVTVDTKSSNESSDDQNAGNFDMAFTGWSVGPDPDSMLAQQTCKVVGTELSDSNFCNAEYDALYAQQLAELDREKRKELVQRMQEILYDNVSAIVLTYDNELEAYRSDRFTGFQKQPADGGVITGQNGYWGYYSANPVTADEAADAGEGDSNNTVLIVGGIVTTVAALAVVALLVSRRRGANADERE